MVKGYSIPESIRYDWSAGMVWYGMVWDVEVHLVVSGVG